MSEHQRAIRTLIYIGVFVPIMLLITAFHYLARGVRAVYLVMFLGPSVDMMRAWGELTVSFLHGELSDLETMRGSAMTLARTLECQHPWLAKLDAEREAHNAGLVESAKAVIADHAKLMAEADEDDGMCVHEMPFEEVSAILDALPICQHVSMPPCTRRATCCNFRGEGRCDAHAPKERTDFPWAAELRVYERDLDRADGERGDHGQEAD